MCKHVAAVLYGIGARFDHHPELLFRLRAVDEMELIVHAGKAAPLAKRGPASGKVLESEDLSGIFGLDMAQSASAGAELAEPKPAKAKRVRKAAAAPKGKRKPRKQAASPAPRKRPAVARKPRPAEG
jgi:uncharacterized Zn finger protein